MFDILDEGKFEKVEDFSINDHSAMVEKMEAAKIFADSLTEEQIANLATYFFKLPSEVAMKLWTVMGVSGNELNNTIKLHQSKVDGVSVADRMVEMLRGGDENGNN